MAVIDDAPPFERGSTFYNGSTINSSDLGGLQFEGKKWAFEDLTYTGTTGAKARRSNRTVTCMCVRNVSGIALLPKRLARLQRTGTDGRFFLGRADGYGFATAEYGVFPVDEWLPAAGVPNNDLFWVVIEGPATVLSDLAPAASGVFNVGDAVVALTAATSQATTAGRVSAQDLTGATALLANQVGNRLGRALSAATTANTNSSLLINVSKW